MRNWIVLLPIGALALLIYLHTRKPKQTELITEDLDENARYVDQKWDEAIEALHNCQEKFGAARGSVKELKGWAGGE
jgi:hypothetical protein